MSTNPPNVAEIVLQRVTTRTGRRVRDLSVEVGSGRVVLRGRAGSFYVKQLAQHGAREVLPEARVENAIVVE
jgi:osmotically-inducible protein OsmY